MALDPMLQKAVELALADDGQTESPLGSNRSPYIDLCRPKWKQDELLAQDRAAGKHVKGDAWCSWWVTFQWFRAFHAHPLGRQIGGCYELARTASTRDMWLSLEGVGQVDLIIGAYPGCAFVILDRPFKLGPSAGHTGMVTAVSPDGRWVRTIEGNSGQRVRRGVRCLVDGKISGLVLPFGLGPCVEDWKREAIDTTGVEISREATR